jgi:hypothetical protein
MGISNKKKKRKTCMYWLTNTMFKVTGGLFLAAKNSNHWSVKSKRQIMVDSKRERWKVIGCIEDNNWRVRIGCQMYRIEEVQLVRALFLKVIGWLKKWKMLCDWLASGERLTVIGCPLLSLPFASHWVCKWVRDGQFLYLLLSSHTYCSLPVSRKWEIL